MQKQYYYDFAKQMQNIKSEIYARSISCDNGTRVMDRQINNIKIMLQQRNREMEARLSTLKSLYC